ESENFILLRPLDEQPIGPLRVQSQDEERNIPELVWPGSAYPAAELQLEVNELSFRTGEKGGQMFYGFSPSFHNEYNNGTRPNEFPLMDNNVEPSWFYRHFENQGKEPFDARAGLDLGEG